MLKLTYSRKPLGILRTRLHDVPLVCETRSIMIEISVEGSLWGTCNVWNCICPQTCKPRLCPKWMHSIVVRDPGGTIFPSRIGNESGKGCIKSIGVLSHPHPPLLSIYLVWKADIAIASFATSPPEYRLLPLRSVPHILPPTVSDWDRSIIRSVLILTWRLGGKKGPKKLMAPRTSKGQKMAKDAEERANRFCGDPVAMQSWNCSTLGAEFSRISVIWDTKMYLW